LASKIQCQQQLQNQVLLSQLHQFVTNKSSFEIKMAALRAAIFVIKYC
jgi:hypothetical protein